MIKETVGWVSDNTKISDGLDLLGLRLPNLTISNYLLSGITTITPTVRYFSLRAWIIQFYNNFILNKNKITISNFAAKVESVVVLANLYKKPGMSGLIGYNKATEILKRNDSVYPLQRLTNNIAFSIYSNPSYQLDISRTYRNRNYSLSERRGLKLANCINKYMEKSKLFHQMKSNPEFENVNKETLEEISELFDMKVFFDDEKSILIDTIIPPNPIILDNKVNEINRVISYTILLLLSKELGGIPSVIDFFSFIRKSNGFINETIQETINGWLVYHIRDMLATIHEAVLDQFVGKLRIRQNQNLNTHIYHIIEEMLDNEKDFQILLSQFHLNEGQNVFNITINELKEKLNELLIIENESEGLLRWTDNIINEEMIIDLALHDSKTCLILLPISWLLARHRFQAYSIYLDNASIQGFARLGLREVIIPKLDEWEKNNEKLINILPEMIQRTIDQHLRITWARLANDPTKDVSLFWDDESIYRHQNDFNPGRTNSRLGQVVRWLGQLDLVNDTGLTDYGENILNRNLSILAKIK